MAVRSGMANLITRLRALSGAGTSEYQIANVTYFSDQHCQDILDGNAYLLEAQPVRWMPDTVGGSITYNRAAIGFRDMEEADSGTPNWGLRDSIGAAVGTANYSVDYIGGYLTFPINQVGTAYYLTARSYDLNSAAADVWARRAAYYAPMFDFSSDQQSLKRSQAYQAAKDMEKEFRQKAGANKERGNVRTSVFLRTDLNPVG